MKNKDVPLSVGARVRVVNNGHRHGSIGYIVRAEEWKILDDFLGYRYYVRFADDFITSYAEASVIEAPFNTDWVKKMSFTFEGFKARGSILTVFTESSFLAESTDLNAIRGVQIKDVTSKYFVDWFFKLDDWVDTPPDRFPYEILTQNYDIGVFVYGYFNKDKLDGLIRIEEYDDFYEISFFCVKKDLQDRGIGQYLFDNVLRRFRDKKLLLYVYQDNDLAIHIYKKHGFKIIGNGDGKGYYPSKPHYIMERDAPRSAANKSLQTP